MAMDTLGTNRKIVHVDFGVAPCLVLLRLKHIDPFLVDIIGVDRKCQTYTVASDCVCKSQAPELDCPTPLGKHQSVPLSLIAANGKVR